MPVDLLGVRDKVEAHGFVRKGGAYFEWGPENWGNRLQPSGGLGQLQLPGGALEFDQLLLDRALPGVEVHEGISVREILFGADRPVAARWARVGDREDAGTIAFDYLVKISAGPA